MLTDLSRLNVPYEDGSLTGGRGNPVVRQEPDHLGAAGVQDRSDALEEAITVRDQGKITWLWTFARFLHSRYRVSGLWSARSLEKKYRSH